MAVMTVISVRKLERAIFQAMLDWLAPHGFVAAAGGGVERWQGDRYDFLGCVVSRIGGKNCISPFGQMGFGHIQNLYSHFMSDDPDESNKIAVDVQLRYAHFVKDWNNDMHCQHTEEVGAFLIQLRSFVMEELYPTLESYKTPEHVLGLYLKKNERDRKSFDPPSWFGCSSALTGLIVARLHVPDQYAALKQRYRDQFDGLDDDTLSRAKKLIAYLDQPQLAPLPKR
jgi:hypothetical protein